MSDAKRDTSDDSTSRKTFLLPKCPYCGIYKIMAKSRLFWVPKAFGNEHGRWNSDSLRRMSCMEPIPYYRLKGGIYRGCRFCGLLADAITARRKGEQLYEVNVLWSLIFKGGQFLMVCEAKAGSYFCSRMYIARGTGKYSINRVKFAVKKK